MSIEEQIAELIDRYERETDRNQSEADLRAGYIDQLFFTLGWNIYNDPGQATNYRREGYIRGAGYVDVGLEIAGEPVLMLEAKRFGALPRSAERTYDRTPEEKQLFRYAHRGKKIPYCMLTNFERLHVFNADHEVLILSFDNPTEYLDRLDELQRLSPDKVKAGSLQDWERKREIKPIDKEFLTSLQDWRLRLANTIYEHNLSNSALQSNGSFDFGKLMEAVQRILDRLILIRYADDREVLKQYDILHNIVSSYHNLGAYSRHDHLMRGFIELSHSMDSEHNTTLFQPGHLCEQVSIPNEVLASIIKEMNNISFRKFTSDILGNTYETYLGTKLALKNGEIKSEERRDIRKAGGIFYTPTMVVCYIVDNTLGQLLKELESQHGLQAIEKGQEIRVLDPACGSGSFLIYAYQVLADFYRRMNKVIENEQVKLLASVSNTDMFQRLELFKHLPKPLENYPHHILEKQLYGVDIDAEAAEIAAVNLTMQAFADTKREKLPLILNENIKVGNSLISGGEEELKGYFGDDWQEKKPFSWEREFKDIMANGGFDVVIGNPPYLGFHGFKEDKDYFRNAYETCQGRFDIYLPFVERGIKLLRDGGLLGFICPTNFTKRQHGQALRKFLKANCKILQIIDFQDERVFEEALNYTGIFIFQKSEPVVKHCLNYISRRVDGQRFLVEQDALQDSGWVFRDEASGRIVAKIESQPNILLGELAESISEGIVTGKNQAFLLPTDTADKLGLEKELLKLAIQGRQIQRYFHEPAQNVIIYPYQSKEGHAEPIPEQDLARLFPVTWQYLCSQRQNLSGRRYFDESPKAWYELWCERSFLQQEPSKIIVPELASTNRFAPCEESTFYLDTSCGILLKNKELDNYLYLLGVLNSSLLAFYYKKTTVPKAGGFYIYKTMFLKQLPIRRIDFSNPAEKKIHDDLVALVSKMLELNKRLAPIRNTPSSEREELLREIKRTDTEIDQKVYELYGLTEEEIQVIETSLVSKSSSRSRQAKG